jgi:hypothetical protein
MEDEPSRLLCDSKVAPNFIGANSVLAIYEHPEGDKPFIKGDWRILEDSSNFDGELLRALFALPSPLCSEIIVLAVGALCADRTLRPAHLSNGVDANLLVTEVSDSLLKCLWLFHAPNIAGFAWLVKYIIALARTKPHRLKPAPLLLQPDFSISSHRNDKLTRHG